LKLGSLPLRVRESSSRIRLSNRDPQIDREVLLLYEKQKDAAKGLLNEF
jgi:hypothetical protein